MMGMSKFRVLVKGIVQYQDSYLAVERWYDDRILTLISGNLLMGRWNSERHRKSSRAHCGGKNRSGCSGK